MDFNDGEQMSNATEIAPGWFPDPTGRHERRYWDGAAWTEHVFSAGSQSTDPMPSAAETVVESNVVDASASRRSARESGTAHSVPATTLTPHGSVEADTKSRKVSFFGAKKQAESLITENERLEALISQYGLNDVSQLDEIKRGLRDRIAAAEQELARVRAEAQASETERAQVQDEIVNLRDTAHLQEYGLFDFENPAESSVALATELEVVRAEIKRLVRAGDATAATSNFTFNNSAAKGRKFVNDMSKLLLRAYNAEAENCIKTVRAGNLAAAQKRLSTVSTQVERLGTMIDLRITSGYHRLRLKELELASRHLQALQVEKEMERARRDELREQKKAEQELAREKERLQKERTHYLNALAALEAKGDVEGAERLRGKLDDVEHAIENVDYRAANIRAGYVYVISNIGAFGPDVVKIGLTRRLDPMDRVNELGDASVPFRFDVHALFFADDAVAVETMLHQEFAGQRLNKVNLRREYFRATPEQVLTALREHNVEVLEFTLEPAAAEYRSSMAPQA
ncbi:DUF4041 domain-containing protein [Microbacterium wangruii]|uniref:DUF4041 domain-containing protein n=1 Tax=Microbacterium wangruii TaxID=3049073 RepID=UPI00256EFD03|nr:DUF4041 domain-containing protein [Microbacterium sp. zg-Y1211]MDL5485943.1 DUF4041 domain-containing protein [Microbacterium sp. zg-Y1211]